MYCYILCKCVTSFSISLVYKLLHSKNGLAQPVFSRARCALKNEVPPQFWGFSSWVLLYTCVLYIHTNTKIVNETSHGLSIFMPKTSFSQQIQSGKLARPIKLSLNFCSKTHQSTFEYWVYT